MRGKYYMDKVWRAILAQVCCLALLGCMLFQTNPLLPAGTQSSPAMVWLRELFRLRTDLLVKGDIRQLEPFYDRDTIGGSWALEKEQARTNYMRQWLQERKIDLLKTEVEFTRTEEDVERDRAIISVCVHTFLTYRHRDYPDTPETTMGWRSVHWLEARKKSGQWALVTEWFVDPLENASQRPSVAPSSRNLKAGGGPGELWSDEVILDRIEGGAQSWRVGAVRYAERYSGVKLGAGIGRYNQAYRDFSGIGGDCANFVSQALGDKEGGNLPNNWGWFYAKGEGTMAWLKAGALVHHFTGNGQARCIARGTLEEVCASTADYPSGAIRELLPGDIIAYERAGEIVHLSLVVGVDPGGYLLVNSHTADRHRVPWDLGYSAQTIFRLIHVTANNPSK